MGWENSFKTKQSFPSGEYYGYFVFRTVTCKDSVFQETASERLQGSFHR